MAKYAFHCTRPLFVSFGVFVCVSILKQKLRHSLFVTTTDTPYKASLFCLKVGIDGSSS